MWFDMSFVINTHPCFKQSVKSYANLIHMVHGVTKLCDTYLSQAAKVCLDNKHTDTALQSTQWLTLWCCISRHTCGSPNNVSHLLERRNKIRYIFGISRYWHIFLWNLYRWFNSYITFITFWTAHQYVSKYLIPSKGSGIHTCVCILFEIQH